MSCARILLQPGQGRDSLGSAGSWKSQGHVQFCLGEQDLPGPAAVLAQAGAVLEEHPSQRQLWM